MLTLPSSIHRMAGSLRRFSNGSTRMDCRGLTPGGTPPSRVSGSATPAATTQSAAAAAQRPSRRPFPGADARGAPVRAARNSSPVWNRSAGAFSRARATASASAGGQSERSRPTGVGRSLICFETTTRLGPVKGGMPVSIS